MLGKLKRLAVGLLVVLVVAGGGYAAWQSAEAEQAGALEALPYVTGTELAERAYQAFRAQGTRIYEVQCPAVAEKELGVVIVCTAEDEDAAPLAIEATMVESPVKLFEFQRA